VAVIEDIMSRPVFSVYRDTTLADAVKLLTEHHFSGAPVLSSTGVVVGIISDLALLDILFDSTLKDAPVGQFMERSVHMVEPDEPLDGAAYLFALYGVRRLPVVQRGNLVGIVTRRDLMNYALHSSDPISEPLVELIPALGRMT
jgi:tRNA nucleotidyltransferase (CCA-adding enzyme)